MSGFPIVDLVVGMIFIYFLLSIINNSIIELLVAVTRLRAVFLKLWLVEVFHKKIANGIYKDTFVYSALINHCAINNLSEKDKSTSYISPEDFSSAMIEIITSDQNLLPDSLDHIETAIKTTDILPVSIQRIFLMYCTNARQLAGKANSTITEIDGLKDQIGNWFKSAMERTGGFFKRRTLLYTVFFATIITCAMNIDSIALMKYLYSNQDARKNLAAMAYRSTSDTAYTNKYIGNKQMASKDTAWNYTEDSLIAEYGRRQNEMATAYVDINSSIPIGWGRGDYTFFKQQYKLTDSTTTKLKFALSKLSGFIVTILAMCLGAPFWFSVLSKIANIRSSTKPL